MPGRAAASRSATASAPQALASATATSRASRDARTASPVSPLTRAQVYRELVHAERDGRLAQLDRELYSH
ncbi:DUF4148 domain-containing protein [Burkholderia territorii]|uniref:DUF4148 domain-containing protein n=1 Tax=Burkholderia territorii TaxID=1503055 RepID=UPI001E450C23|nr:DUF4148 domain-containing protein [Burkholderia territorii]